MTTQEKAEKYAEGYRCPATNKNEYCKHDIISAYNTGYIQCQKDMAKERKEIQPEDIWNEESQDSIKEHILNHANNQSSEDILETELMADEIKKLFDAELKELQHHRDTMIGLYAIDFNPKGLIKRFVNSQSDATRLPVEDVEDLVEDWVKWLNDENVGKSPFFQL